MNMQQAIHEVGHGIIAVLNGYILNAVRLDGPPDNPGKIERTIPDGMDGNDPAWARRELAVFCAGYVAEYVFYGWNNKDYITGHPESDRPMMDQCALVHLQIQPDIETVLAYEDPGQDFDTPRHHWRSAVAIDWQPYDELIHTVEKEVTLELVAREYLLGCLARTLLKKTVLTGAEFIAEME